MVIRLWNTATRKEQQALVGHEQDVKSTRFSPNGKYLASSADDGVRLWEVTSGKQLQHWPGRSPTINFSPDSKLLAVVAAEKSIRLWDTASGKEHFVWNSLLNRLDHLVFSPDGTLMASANQNVLVVWNTATGKEVRQINKSNGSIFMSNAIALSPSGRVVAGVEFTTRKLPKGDFDNVCTIRLWELLTGQEIL